MKITGNSGVSRCVLWARGKLSPPFEEESRNYAPFSLIIIVLLISLITAVPACKQPTAPDAKTDLSFTLEDASCTETWINIKAANYGSGFRFALNRNDSTIMQFPSLPGDTVIVDEGHRPGRNLSGHAGCGAARQAE